MVAAYTQDHAIATMPLSSSLQTLSATTSSFELTCLAGFNPLK